MLLPTPKYDLSEHPEVYEPSEDTFLFLDALEKEMGFLKGLESQFVVEIGSGSGIVVTALASFIDCLCFATDINLNACRATVTTATLNQTTVNCVNMDLLCGFRENIFDVVLFNPPYVVTDPTEIEGYGLNRAWAGGSQGRQIINQVLQSLDKFLSNKGVCYMVLLKENNIPEIKEIMCKNKFQTDIILERKIRGEHLYVVKFSRFL